MGTTTTTTTSTTTTTTTTTFTTTAATSTLTTTAISSTTAKTSGMAPTTASTTTTKPVTNASNSSGKGILPSNTPAISTVIGQVTTDKSLWDLFDSSKISQMLSGRETDMQEEGKIETQDTKVHPDVKVLHEDIMFEGTIEEPEATLETHKDAEIEEEAAAPESKLNITNKKKEKETLKSRLRRATGCKDGLDSFRRENPKGSLLSSSRESKTKAGNCPFWVARVMRS